MVYAYTCGQNAGEVGDGGRDETHEVDTVPDVLVGIGEKAAAGSHYSWRN